MPINQLNNGDSGLTARTIINELVASANSGSGGNINTGSFATTGSNSFNGNQTITGSIDITGDITFTEPGAFISQTSISSSIYISSLNGGLLQLNRDGGEGDIIMLNGENKVIINGNTITTGSVDITGSLTLNNVTGDLRPYKIFVGLLTQTSNNPPVITELENTLGSNVSTTYQGTGDYAIYSTSSFTVNKTFLYIGNNSDGLNYPQQSGFKQIQYIDVNRLNILCVNTSYANVNDVLVNTPFEIRVYN